MRRSLLALCLALAVLLCMTSTATAQKPVIVGEHVDKTLDTPHPYTGSGQAVPTLTWTDRLHHPGAVYVAVHFARMELAPGDHVVVRSEDGAQRWTYTLNGRQGLGTHPDGFFATHLKGDTAIVELFTVGNSSAFGYTIDKYGRGYSDQEIQNFWDAGLGESMNLAAPPQQPESVCTTDDTEEAKCYEASEPAAYDKARAVVRLLQNGAAHCTGWLIGQEGHMMTNEHCITSQAQTNNIDFEFMAEGPDCATNCGSSLACAGTIEASGGTFVTDDAALDYALVIPDTSTGTGTDLPATYGFMRLRPTGAVLNERIYIVQHPAGWGKRFAMLSSYPEDTGLGGFAYATSLTEAACSGGANDVGYWADTQGGSSGSPVLGYSDHRVVALHHCRGSAFCTSGNPGSDDRNRGVPIEAVIASLGANLPNGAVCDPPPVPTGLAAASGGDNQIDLTWTAGTDGPATYNVYRATGTCPATGFELIASDVAGTSYADTTVSAEVDYAYQVRSFDAGASCESLASTCSSASTTGLCTLPPSFDGIQTVTNAGTATCSVQLGWNDATGFCAPTTEGTPVVYNVYRQTAGAEGGPSLLASCVAGTTYNDTTADFGTDYEYFVRAEDQSGNGTGACASGNQSPLGDGIVGTPTGPDVEQFADDIESGPTNFATGEGPNNVAGTTPWEVVTTDSHSPTHAWFVAEQPSVKDQVVGTASATTIPAGAILEFWHRYDTEATFDGGVLEYSTDGTNWNDIGDRFLEGEYNSTLSTGFSNPLPGRMAWSGDSMGFVRVQVDLSDFATQDLQFRWRFGCDSSVTDTGWWVDDVRIFFGSMCGDPIFTDGFESGDTLLWTQTVPPPVD